MKAARARDTFVPSMGFSKQQPAAAQRMHHTPADPEAWYRTAAYEDTASRPSSEAAVRTSSQMPGFVGFIGDPVAERTSEN